MERTTRVILNEKQTNLLKSLVSNLPEHTESLLEEISISAAIFGGTDLEEIATFLVFKREVSHFLKAVGLNFSKCEVQNGKAYLTEDQTGLLNMLVGDETEYFQCMLEGISISSARDVTLGERMQDFLIFKRDVVKFLISIGLNMKNCEKLSEAVSEVA